jgi:hypothetical protein
MLIGLLFGKQLLLFSVKRSSALGSEPGEISPRMIVFVCCALQAAVLFAVRTIIVRTNEGYLTAEQGFMAYSVLFGGVNGLLTQMYFPDRKPAVRAVLLFANMFGVFCFNFLTTYWFGSNQDVANMMANLTISFIILTCLGTLMITIPTTSFVKKGDKRALQFSLLNTYDSDEETKRLGLVNL